MRKSITLITLFTALITPFILRAETHYGWAMLAVQHKSFDCRVTDRIAKRYPRPYLSYLDGDFGRKMSCIESFIQNSGTKSHVVQSYLENSVCRRKRNCGRGSAFREYTVRRYNKKLSSGSPKLKKKIIARAQRILGELMAISSPTTKVWLAMGLETQLTKSAAISLHGYLIEAGWDREQIVINQVNNAPQFRAGAKYLERHGTLIPDEADGASLDGECNTEICNCRGFDNRSSKGRLEKLIKKSKHLKYLAAWCPKHQGLNVNSTTQAPPPRKREVRPRIKDVKKFGGHI